MGWQIERQEELVDDTLLENKLIEVCHHVFDARQVLHLYLEAHALGVVHIEQFYVHTVRSPEPRPSSFLISVSNLT